MHLPLYLAASLVGDLRRTCQPTSHGRIRVSRLSVLLLLLSTASLSSSLFDSLVLLASGPPLLLLLVSFPGGPVHKAGTVSQAAGHPVTCRGPFEVFEKANSRDRTPNEISRYVHPRAASLFPLFPRWHRVATQLWDDASRGRIRGKVEKDYELQGILLQAGNYSPPCYEKHLQRSHFFPPDRKTLLFHEDYLPLRPDHSIWHKHHCVLIRKR